MRVLSLLSVWLVPADSSSHSACDGVSFNKPWLGSLPKGLISSNGRIERPNTQGTQIEYAIDMTKGFVDNIRRMFGEAGCMFLANLSKRLPNDPPSELNTQDKFLSRKLPKNISQQQFYETFNLIVQLIRVAKSDNHGIDDPEKKDFEFRLIRTLGILDHLLRKLERPGRIEEIQRRFGASDSLSKELADFQKPELQVTYDTDVAFKTPTGKSVDLKQPAYDMIAQLKEIKDTSFVSESLRLVARLFLDPIATRNHGCIVKNAADYLAHSQEERSDILGEFQEANNQIPEQSWRRSLANIHRKIGRCTPIGL